MNALRQKTLTELPIARAGIADEIKRLRKLSRPTPERHELQRLLDRIDALILNLDGEIPWRKACEIAQLSTRQELLISEALQDRYLTVWAFGWNGR